MFENKGSAIDRSFAVAVGAVLGFACSIALGLVVLLAGRGGGLLAGTEASRVLAWLLLAAGFAASFLIARSLAAALGAAQRSRAGSATDAFVALHPQEQIPRWLICIGLLALLGFISAAIAQTVRAPDGGWDAFAIWNARARSLLRSGGDVRLACDAARGGALFTLHPDYPLLLPTAIALGWRALGSETILVPALLSLLPSLSIAAIAALVIARDFGRRNSRRRGVWVWAILLTTPELATMASAQYAEALLDALLMAGAALLVCAWQIDADSPARRRVLSFAGLAFAIAASVKHEGLLMFFAAAVAVLRMRPRDLVPMALGAALPLALFAWFAIGFAPPGDLASASFGALFARAMSLPRLEEIALALLRRIVYLQAWGLHLAAFALVLFWRLRRRDLALPARGLFLFCAIAFAGFVAALLTTPHELAWHLRTSIDRLILQLWPSALLALALPGSIVQRAPAMANPTSSAGVVSR